MCVSTKLATLYELQTVYGLEDVYDMLEVVMIDNRNQSILEKSLGKRD